MEELKPTIVLEPPSYDTTEDFNDIFNHKTHFDSWEEFSTLFEAFQKKSGSVYKPKSATSVEYANERRIRDRIPARFVYSNVKMICAHFGQPVKKEGSQLPPTSYKGRGCQACVCLCYRGSTSTLNITRTHFVHTNHEPNTGEIEIKQIRAFSFNDELDMTICREVHRKNPFEFVNGEKEWKKAVEDLKVLDPRLMTITPRMIKKRMRFLMDRFKANSNGKPPLADDEMGQILYDLTQQKQATLDNPLARGRRRESVRLSRGQRMQKRKLPLEDQYVPLTDNVDDIETGGSEEESFGKHFSHTASPNKKSDTNTSFSPTDISSFLMYLKRKDEEDRKLREQEIELRKQEIALHRQEMELNRSRFEFDKTERLAQLELLKKRLASSPERQPICSPNKEPIKGYTLLVNDKILKK